MNFQSSQNIWNTELQNSKHCKFCAVSLNIEKFRTEISSFVEILTEDQNISGASFHKIGNSKTVKLGRKMN